MARFPGVHIRRLVLLGQHAAENAGIIAKATATLADTKCKQDTAIGKKRKARDHRL